MGSREYRSPEAFRTALEQRIRREVGGEIATIGALDSVALREAIHATFAFRDTHGVPEALPLPVESWARPYERMATQDELPWRTLAEVHEAAAKFLDPLLGGGDGGWNHVDWLWR